MALLAGLPEVNKFSPYSGGFTVLAQHCLKQDIEVTWPPTDMPWNVREMHVRHPDGHVFRIGRGLEDE